MPAIAALGLALLPDLLLLEPALLDLLPGGDAGGVAVLDAVVDSGPPLGGTLLGADGSLDTDRAFNTLALDPLRSGALDALAFDALPFNALRSGALALDPLPLGALCANPLANLRTLGADPLADLRAFGADSLLAALGGLRAGCRALCALLGAVSLLGALLGAVATLGVRRSGDCECRHCGDQKCLGHKEFQYCPVVPPPY